MAAAKGAAVSIVAFVVFALAVASSTSQQTQEYAQHIIIPHDPPFQPPQTNWTDSDLLPTNLTVIPDDWYDVVGTQYDPTVTHNGNPSWKLNAVGYNEANSWWTRVYPGDVVYFGAWIKSESYPVGAGAIFGFDCYGPSDRILEVHPRIPQTAIWDIVDGVPTAGGTPIYVPYGNDWTWLEFQVTIPATVYSYDNYGAPITPQQIIGFIPWLGASWNYGETAQVWFSETTLYINPQQYVKAFKYDGLLEKTRVETFTFDGYLKSEQTKTWTVDANLTNRYLKAVTFDAWLQAELTKTFTFAGIPWTVGAFNFDADLLDTYVKAFTVDAWLQKGVPGTFTYDSVLQGKKGVFSFDGFLQWWTATVSRLGFIEAVIAEMQKQNIGEYCFAAGCVEPGCDNVATLIRRAAEQMREA